MVLLSSTAFAFLRIQLEGPDLADKIASVLNKRMRGRIEVESVEWPTRALETVATGGWVPITVRGVKVWDDCVLSAEIQANDPEELRTGDPNEDCTPDDRPDPNPASHRKPRKLLIAAPLITAEVDIHALMFGHHDFVFRNLWVHGGEALLEQTREPYPLHAYDRTIVSIVTAFYPRMKAGFRAGIYADAPPPIFDLRDIHIEHLNLTVHMAPYTLKGGGIGFGMTARLEDVNADAASTGLVGIGPALEQIAKGRDPVLAMAPVFKAHDDNYLHMDATDPLVAKFYVRLALRSSHGRLRVFDEGPRAAFGIPVARGTNAPWGKGRTAYYDIQLSEVVLDRLAQMPTDWARKDYVANTLELDLHAKTIPCASATGAPKPEDGADLHISGELENYWDRPYDGAWNLALDIKNLGPTLHTCIKSKMGGDNLGGRVTLTGPFIALPKVTLDLHGLDYDLPLVATADPLHLTLAEVHGEIDLVNDQGSIEKTKAQIRGGKEPGEVMVSANFGLKPYNARASVDIVKPIDIARFLPAPIPTSVGKFLAGKLTAVGDVDQGFALEDFDLTLGPTPIDKLVRVHRGRLFTENAFATIGVQKVAVEAGRSHAVFDGFIDTLQKTLSITIDGDFPDLDTWLRRFGLPQFAKSAGGGQIVINGPLKSPTVGVRLNLGGVPCMDNLTLDAEVKDQVATIHHVSSTGLGGTLDGNGVVALSTPKVIEKFHLEGRKIDAARLCGLAGVVKGTLDAIDVDIKRTTVVANRPPLDWLSALTAKLTAQHLSVMNDPVSNLAVCVNGANDAECGADKAHLAPNDPQLCSDAKAHGGACVVANATRDLGGALAAMVIDVPAMKTGKTTVPRHLGGTIEIEDIPLTVIDQFVGHGVIGGLFSATLHLQGTGNAPQAEGTLWLIRSWIKDAFVGDSQLSITPIMVGKMPSLFVRGTALAGQLAITGTIGTVAPYPVELAVTARRVEVDPLLDLAKLLKLPVPVQAWASGTLTVHTELKPLDGKAAKPEAWVELTELEAIVDRRSRDGRLTPLRFALRNQNSDAYALSLHVTPQTIELACRDATVKGGRKPCSAALDTPAGVVSIEGGATVAGMNLHATGSLALEKLGGLLESQLDAINGSLALDARVTGTLATPTYKVELVVTNEIHVRPAGVDTTLTVQKDGQILLSDGTLGFNQLIVAVQDDRARQAPGQLSVRGTIALDGVKPASWGVLIDGQIAGKMLVALAPSSVSQASGLARIDGALTLFGHGALPQITGTLTFDPDPSDKHPVPFSISPRGVRKEINVLGGSIDISTTIAGEHRTYSVSINDNPLTASLDGEGKIENVRGDLELRDGTPQSARIDLDAENLPYKIPGTLDLIVSAKDVSLELPSSTSAWIARGNVSIVSGEYNRNFDIQQAIRPEPPKVAPARPFWDEYPAIGNADLALTLDVRRFAVHNNLTPNPIELEGPRIYITGSPRDPRLSGSIRVQRGEFQIPGSRAKFTNTTGSIDFAENDRATNPHLDITSTANYQDISGQQHIITLTIGGTLEQIVWDLKTSTGYDKSQTLALLFLGRNPEQLRRSLGDQAAGSNPQVIETSTNPSAGFADQIVKDLAGQWVSDLLGNSLKEKLNLDMLRFEVGFGSLGIAARLKLLENLSIAGEEEQTIRGTSANVTVELKTPFHPARRWTNDRLTLQGVYLNKNYYDPAELDISDLKGQLVYHLIIP